MSAMKRVLVTGGTGFIGQHTLAPLVARGYEVHVAARHMPGSSLSNVVVHEADLLDCSGHRVLIESIRPSHLLHVAWYAKHGKFWDAIENVHWLKATLSLVEAFYAAGGLRLVGVGTCAEYDWKYGLFLEGETPEIPSSLYGLTKRAACHCSSALANSRSAGFAWARVFSPYGPGEPEGRLIPHVITSLLSGTQARCTHGSQFRDFLHVCDLGDALAAVLDSGIAGAVNVGSGVPVRIKDLVGRIGSALGKEHLVAFGSVPEPSNSPPMILASTSRLTEEVGWMPKLSLDEGLLDTIDWWRDRGAMNSRKGNGNNENGN